MGWIHSALLLSAALGGKSQEPVVYDDYTPAFHAARSAKLPLLVILNSGQAPDQVGVELQDITKARHRRTLLQKFVIADIDTSTPRGQLILGLFRPAALPHVVVIDKEQKYQLYRSTTPRMPEDWNILLERFQQGDLSTLKAPPRPGGADYQAASLNSQDVWCHDFTRAQVRARRLRRPVVLHFYAPWCGPCQKMEREVLNSPGLLQKLDSGFVAVKVNVDDQPQLVQQFKVESLPCDVFVTAQGQVLSQNSGYLAADSYLSKVSQVAKEHSESIAGVARN